MKTPFHLYFILLVGLMSLYSCSRTVYSHQQVLQGMRNKNDVLKQFGKPDDTLKAENVEIWTYNKGELSVAPKPVKTDSAENDSTSDDTLYATQPVDDKRYIKFTFDAAGNVTGYKSNGVDAGVSKRDNFGKSLVRGLEITAGIILIVGVELAQDGYFNR